MTYFLIPFRFYTLYFHTGYPKTWELIDDFKIVFVNDLNDFDVGILYQHYLPFTVFIK